MFLKFIDKKICEAFSDAALQYDVLTSLHEEIGRELSKKVIDTDNADAILDIGMGTGRMTRRISFYFPDSCVVGMDFARGMIEQAQKKGGCRIVQAAAERLPFKARSFDIIVSNLAYQWVSDFSAGFRLCREVLKPEGRMLMTLFGYRTFEELFAALQAGLPGKELPVARLPKREDIERELRAAGFSDVNVDYEIIKAHFPCLADLIKWIQNIGANALPRGFFLGKELFQRANEYYEAHYRERLGIVATFEVIWVETGKPANGR